MSEVYRNKMVINQRGGSIDVDSSTDSEKIQLSQRSGSNKNITNVVTSELVTNNKQDLVINDKFQTVKNDDVEFVGKDKTVRVGENSYELNGFVDEDQIDAHEEWKEAYRDIANLNAKFKIKRGGISLPDGSATDLKGDRADNPVIGSKVLLKVPDLRDLPLRVYWNSGLIKVLQLKAAIGKLMGKLPRLGKLS